MNHHLHVLLARQHARDLHRVAAQARRAALLLRDDAAARRPHTVTRGVIRLTRAATRKS